MVFGCAKLAEMVVSKVVNNGKNTSDHVAKMCAVCVVRTMYMVIEMCDWRVCIHVLIECCRLFSMHIILSKRTH